MKPVVALTATPEQISLGEALDTSIKFESAEEVGRPEQDGRSTACAPA